MGSFPMPRNFRGGNTPYFRSAGFSSPKTPPFPGTVQGLQQRHDGRDWSTCAAVPRTGAV